MCRALAPGTRTRGSEFKSGWFGEPNLSLPSPGISKSDSPVRIVQFEHQTCLTQAALVRWSIRVDLTHFTRVILIRNSWLPTRQILNFLIRQGVVTWAREK